MISEWMDNGNINEFIQKNKEVNRAQLVSIWIDTVLFTNTETDLFDFRSWWRPRSAWSICMDFGSCMET